MTILKRTLFALVFIGLNCQALEHSDPHKKIMQLGEDYVLKQLASNSNSDIAVEAMPIDNRIVIPACSVPYSVSAASNALQQSNVTVKASCSTSDWFLYFVVKVSETQQVVIAANALSPGAVLTAEDITVTKMDKSLLRSSTFADINDIIGARAKRRLTSGQPVTPNQLCFICKGDEITIIAQGAGIQVKATGVAQQDGNIGEQIQVKNDRTMRMVNALVENVSEVIVRL
ncbi:flagellar basal body P-ring formation chaperone FlgA [Neptunicella sp. SCSIO 80796]|uniref:flagellar basal body P-ring formation chaperone FlgA n=1 Tax=Neptunicella plasticusilytica TaxID=3117012 RepID=UPI003A4E4E9D